MRLATQLVEAPADRPIQHPLPGAEAACLQAWMERTPAYWIYAVAFERAVEQVRRQRAVQSRGVTLN